MKRKKKLCNKFLYFSVLFLIVSLLVGTVVGAVKEENKKPSSIDAKITSPEQCQNIRTQQRQIFEKMTRIENQLDAKDVID